MRTSVHIIASFVLVLTSLVGGVPAPVTGQETAYDETSWLTPADLNADIAPGLIQSNANNTYSSTDNAITAIPDGGSLIVISVALDGSTPSGSLSGYPSISADGRYVAFESWADNLVGDDTNGKKDIFVRDVQNGTTVRVSVATDGSQADDNSTSPVISADGRYVAFSSFASNLIDSDSNGHTIDIFIRDRDTDEDGIMDEAGAVETILVSVDSNGIQASGGPGLDFSADGRYVVFEAGSSNLVSGDTNGKFDIFVHDRDTDEDGEYDEPGAIATVRVSIASDGSQSNGNSYTPAISDDGRRIVFVSEATNLISSDTNNVYDIFVHDRDSDEDGVYDEVGAIETTRVSVASDGTQGDDGSDWPAISGDGRYVAFTSNANNLVDDDQQVESATFTHDLVSGQTRRVSVGNDGMQVGTEVSARPVLSFDGRYVAFGSDFMAAYLRDQARGRTVILSAYPDHLDGFTDVAFLSLSPDGRYAVFGFDYIEEIYLRDRGTDLLPPNTPSRLVHVSPTGDDISCGAPITPCRTLWQAVRQANGRGATIKVAGGVYTGVHTLHDGTYYQSFTFNQMLYLNMPITITGGYTVTDWAIPNPVANPTTLDAQGQGRVLYADLAQATLAGLRLVNGNGSYGGGEDGEGGGVRSNESWLTLDGCHLENNVATGGGGLDAVDSTIVLSGSLVISNTATKYYGGGLFTSGGTITLTNNLIQNNTAFGYWGGGTCTYESTVYATGNTWQDNSMPDQGSGGGLSVIRGDLVLTSNSFVNNTAFQDGGGLLAGGVTAGHSYTITDNLFQENTAVVQTDYVTYFGKGGGAMLSSSGGSLLFARNRLLSNKATTGYCGGLVGRGGGAFVQGAAQVVDNLFQNNWGCFEQAETANSSDDYGKDINTSTPLRPADWVGGRGGGLYADTGVQVTGNHFINNYATSINGYRYGKALGGGIYALDAVTITNNVFIGNEYSYDTYFSLGADSLHGGGAIAVEGEPYSSLPDTNVYLYHNTFINNQSAAIYNKNYANMTMSHNIMVGQDIDVVNQRENDYACPVTTLDYTLWWPTMNIQVNDDSGECSLPATTNDFVGSPDFVDDYHLGRNSAARDRGPGIGVMTDIDGHPRPIGAGYDLGADEYTGVDFSSSHKTASPEQAAAGETVTFTLVLHNSGDADSPATLLHDPIPTATTYISGSAQATSGTLDDTDGIAWQGDVGAGHSVTITFRVIVVQEGIIQNTATLTDTYDTVWQLTALVNPMRVYLPLVMRNR